MNPSKKATVAEVTSRLIKLILTMSPDERSRLLQELEQRRIKGRRSSRRATYLIDVHYAARGRVFQGFIQNISPEGVFIKTREPVTVGQKVTLTFPLPHSREHAKVAGEIVRAGADGFGVRFDAALHELFDHGGASESVS
jgi:hypothetical protein